MKIYSNEHKAALRGGHSYAHLVVIELDSQTYRLTDRDNNVDYSGQTYTAGFLKQVGAYEQTAQPTVSDTNLTISTVDDTFRIIALSDNWMNREVTLYRQTLNLSQNAVATTIVFSGRLSAFKDYPEKDELRFTASSDWADFEKVHGIKTNVNSQARFDDTDLAFRHSSDAVKKIFWGRESNSSVTSGGGGGGDDVRFPTPEAN